MNYLRVCPHCEGAITCATRTCPSCGMATNRGRRSGLDDHHDVAPQSVFLLALDALDPRSSRRRGDTTDLKGIVSDI